MDEQLAGIRPWHRTIETRRLATPAAGASTGITVPGGELWRILSIQHLLTTSAAAASREPYLAITDGTGEYIRCALTTHLEASSAATILAAYPLNPTGWVALGASGLPELWVVAGETLTLGVANMDVADTITLPFLRIERIVFRSGPVELDRLYDALVSGPGIAP